MEISRMTQEKAQAWLSASLTGDLKEVPGLGDETVERLRRENIANTFQLLGDFLMQIEEPAKTPQQLQTLAPSFKKRLTELNSPPQYRVAVADAMMMKVCSGFKLPAGVQVERVSSTKMSQEKWDEFNKLLKDVPGQMGKQYWLTGDLTQDFAFIGEKTAKNLAKSEVTSSFKLVGKYLKCIDLENPEKAGADFKEFLGKQGQGIQSSAIVAQVQQVVDRGLAVYQPVTADIKGRNLSAELENEAMTGDHLKQRQAGAEPTITKKPPQSSVSDAVAAKKQPQTSASDSNTTLIMAGIVFVLLMVYLFLRR
eukprot:g81093.t1